MKTRVKLWQDSDPAPSELIQKIKGRRKDGKLIALDRLLLNSFPLAEGWNEYLKRIRSELSLNGELRELLICRIAQLNKAPYEWEQHVGVYLAEGGTEEKASEIMTWQKSRLFNEKEKALLALTDESTRNIEVPDAVFQDLKKHFSDQHIVEAVGVIACYNMVSRFLVALHLEDMTQDNEK
ncbi:Carboxymuconolactone decarboxylase family protein [compost metagenome]